MGLKTARGSRGGEVHQCLSLSRGVRSVGQSFEKQPILKREIQIPLAIKDGQIEGRAYSIIRRVREEKTEFLIRTA